MSLHHIWEAIGNNIDNLNVNRVDIINNITLHFKLLC